MPLLNVLASAEPPAIAVGITACIVIIILLLLLR